MTDIYTRDGRPLSRQGDDVFTTSGTHIGRASGDRVFGPGGDYIGTLDGDRLVYRSTDSASMGSPFAPAAGSGSAAGNAAASAIWGDEPNIPD